MNLRLNTDLAAGLFGLLFAALFWFSLGRLSHLSAVFPETILILTFLVSLGLIAKGLSRPDIREFFEEGSRLRLAVTTLALFAWWWAIGWLGFFVASALAFLFLVCYLAAARHSLTPRRLGVWAVVVVAEVAFFYIVFSKLLYIRPPGGLLF